MVAPTPLSFSPSISPSSGASGQATFGNVTVGKSPLVEISTFAILGTLTALVLIAWIRKKK